MFVVADNENRAAFKQPGRKAWKKAKVQSVANLRLASLNRLIEGRHGGPVDTDDGELYYLAALPHLVARAWAYGNQDDAIGSVTWAGMYTYGLWAEKPVAWFQEQEQRVLREFDNHNGVPSLPSADELAQQLGITQQEVRAYGLRTIGAVDRLKAQRIAEEREADRLYQKAKRASKGARPHEQSISARKPWLDHGIKSRRTWERMIERGELPPDPLMRKAARDANSSGDANSSETGEAVPNDALSGISSTVSLLPVNDDVMEAVRQTAKHAA